MSSLMPNVGLDHVFATPGPDSDRRDHSARVAQPLFIYQMGKVASTSLFWALKARLGATEILDAHLLTPAYLDDMVAWLRDSQWEMSWRDGLLHYLADSRQLGQRFARDNSRVTIITLARDPLAQPVSAFFQHIDAYGSVVWQPDDGHAARCRRLLDYFDRETRRWARGEPVGDLASTLAQFLFDVPHRWFDAELRETFGVDVFDAPFPHEAGYQMLTTPRADVLILRVEDLGRCVAPALDAFLGLENVSLGLENVSDAKPSGTLVREVSTRIQFAPEVAIHAYSTKYARHFYSREERQGLARRWTGQDVTLPE